jgi:hypothetical protein
MDSASHQRGGTVAVRSLDPTEDSVSEAAAVVSRNGAFGDSTAPIITHTCQA